MIRKLHHIGIASRNIQADISFYGLLGYAAKGTLREDDNAGIKVQFMSAEGQPDIELVQNLVKDGPMTPHLQAKELQPFTLHSVQQVMLISTII